MWAQKVSFGGSVLGLAAPGDPDVWTTITPDQQKWVTNTIVTLDKKIQAQTKTTCPGMQTGSITGIAGCFQNWFNSAKTGLTKSNGSLLVLRNDGVFDQDTLDALRTVAALSPVDFPTPFPGTEMAGTGEKKGLSTGAMVGIGAGVVAAVGGVAYLATRGSSRKSRK
jgi:hypothetical protein